MADINTITDNSLDSISKVSEFDISNISKIAGINVNQGPGTPQEPIGYTADLADTPANATGSTHYSTGREVGNCFDDMNGGFKSGYVYHTTIAEAKWVQYDFGEGNEKQIRKYNITGPDDATYYQGMAPKDWTFEGSNNASDWDVLDTQSDQTVWTQDVFNEYESNWTDNGQSMMIGEIEMMEGIYE